MDLQTLAVRIDRLECRNRSVRRIGGVLALTVVIGLTMGQVASTDKPTTDVVRAREFWVVDEYGRLRASLAYDKKTDTAALLIGDGRSVPIRIGTVKDAAGVVAGVELVGPKGRLSLYASGESAGLVFVDGRGEPRATLGMTGSDGGFFILSDKNGRAIYGQHEQGGIDNRK